VGDDHEASQPQQIGPAVGVRVEPFAQASRGGTDEEAAELPPRARLDLLSELVEERLDRPFHELERHVPREAVADDHVGCVREQLTALDVADEVEMAGLENRMRLADEAVSLLRLLTDREEGDLRVGDAQDLLDEDGAHVPELDEMLRTSVSIRARVDQHRSPADGRERHGDRRPVDVRKPADLEESRREHRARVPRRDDGLRVALAHRAAGGEHRAFALLARHVGGLLVHRDDVVGMNDFQTLRERREDFLPAEKHRLDAVRSRRERTRDDLLRGSIAAHRVDGDPDLRHRYGAGVSSGSTSRPR
jgi:hypothetical protein